MGRWDDEDDRQWAPGPRNRGEREREDGKNGLDARSGERPRRERSRSRSRSPTRGERKGSDRDKGARWGKDYRENTDSGPADAGAPPQKPEFGLSGLLAAETNTTEGGVLLKHQEPPEKGVPSDKWRIYIFKDGKPLDQPLKISSQSNYLFGRDRRVVDVATDHQSCSLQHAVIQHRTTDKKGQVAVRPYLMDLGSTNGTFLNGDRVEASRYYELLAKDVVTFGSSTREYVLLKE